MKEQSLEWLAEHVRKAQAAGFCKLIVHIQNGQITLVEKTETYKPPAPGMLPRDTGN
jgi:hypothetical protein